MATGGVAVKGPASCHRDRRAYARGACRPCYERASRRGTLAEYPSAVRFRADFVPDYETLRGQGLTRIEIAGRLGMTRAAIDAAYSRAVRAGELPPDPPHMRHEACLRAREKGLRA